MNYLRGNRGPMPAAILVSVLLAAAAFGAENPYLVGRFLQNGQMIDEIIVPGRPPEIKAMAAQVPEPHVAAGINVLSGVPAFTWCYGCSATSAAMMMGYYDRNGYSNMYAGPANGGLCPLNNVTFWGNSPHSGGEGECPLSATHQGVDGRATRGHVDDYWIDYDDPGPDPWIVNGWIQHTQGDCTGDYMGTNQSSFFTDAFGPNTDGSTIFYFGSGGAALSNYTGCEPDERDGCHGMRLFAESRGYTVTANFSQYIYPNPVYTSITQGFTYADYRAEIDAGRPVMIQVLRHSMVGYGYDDSSSIIYIHDTWDNNNHSMTWGGSYGNGMRHYGVTVLRLAASVEPPIELVHVLYPSDSGITLERGKSYVVQWQTVTEELTAKTPMQITLQDGVTSWILAPSVPNTGFWIWKKVGTWKSKTQPPYLDGDAYRIVVSTADGSASDTSDSTFAIATIDSLTVDGDEAPVGGSLTPPQYTCTGHFNVGGGARDVSSEVKWSCAKIKGVKMGKTGLLATVPVLDDVACTITASYGKGKPPVTGTLPIVITP